MRNFPRSSFPNFTDLFGRVYHASFRSISITFSIIRNEVPELSGGKSGISVLPDMSLKNGLVAADLLLTSYQRIQRFSLF